ncbi:MAG: hypothetical protein HKM07_04345 [Chlamydiae bacterium]|nr:hypothetical protein [Chlamydiota bacterium]
MDKLKIIFLVFTALCFINIAVAEDSSRPILKVIPAPKNLKEENICDYLLVVDNFPKGELFVITCNKFLYRDLGCFVQEIHPSGRTFPQDNEKSVTLFFAISIQHYLPGDSISFRCVDISKNSGTNVYFTPNPIGNEDLSRYEALIESNPLVIERYYEELKKGRIYTLADMEERFIEVPDEKVLLDGNSEQEIEPPAIEKNKDSFISDMTESLKVADAHIKKILDEMKKEYKFDSPFKK